jgi:ABC-type transporter Mla subunit MlaD
VGALDLLTAPVRAILGATEKTEHDVISRSPLHQTSELERELKRAVDSIHRAADSMERHVAVLETLATSVPALTESVNALVRELNGLLGVLAPVAEAERDVSRFRHLFGHRHVASASSSPRTQAETEPPADPGRT